MKHQFVIVLFLSLFNAGFLGAQTGSGAGGATSGSSGSAGTGSANTPTQIPIAPRERSVYPGTSSGLPPVNSGVTPGGGPVGINPGVQTPLPPAGPVTTEPGVAAPAAPLSPVIPGTQATNLTQPPTPVVGGTNFSGNTNPIPAGVVSGTNAPGAGMAGFPTNFANFSTNNFPAALTPALARLYAALVQALPEVAAFNDQEATLLGLVPPSRVGRGPYTPVTGAGNVAVAGGTAVIDRNALRAFLALEADMQRTLTDLVVANTATAMARTASSNMTGVASGTVTRRAPRPGPNPLTPTGPTNR